MRSYALVEWTRYDPAHRKPLFNPMWSGLFANLKRLGGGGEMAPSELGYFKSDDDET